MSSIIIEQHRNMGHGREKAHTNDHRGIVDLYTAEKHDSKHRNIPTWLAWWPKLYYLQARHLVPLPYKETGCNVKYKLNKGQDYVM